VYGLGSVLGQAAAFVLLPLYTNLLSPTDYGTLEIIILTSTCLNVFLGLHVMVQIPRLYHAAEREEARGRAVSTAIIFSGALTTAAIIPADLFRHQLSVALFGTAAHGDHLRLALWWVVATNVFVCALAYLQARRMSRAFTLLSVAQLVSMLSLNLVFVAWLRRGVEGILLSQLLVTGTLGLGLAAWVLGRTGVAFSWATVRTILAFGLPMIGWSLAVFVVNGADRAVLSGVASLTDVGVYSLANRFGMSLLVFVVTPFSCFWAAERFELAKQPGGRDVMARVFTYFFAVLCFVGLAVSIWVDDLIRLMAAPQFWAAAGIGPVLVLAYALWGTFDALMTGIVIEGHTKAVGALTGAAAAIHVGLCAGLGPALGTIGVAWAKVATLAALTVGVYIIAQRRYRIGYEAGRVARVVAVALALFFVSTALAGFPPLLGLALKAPLLVAFPVVLAGVGFLDAGERRWLTARLDAALSRRRGRPRGLAAEPSAPVERG
jgi:O-antigen/teichoic acid export membrane protein